MSSYGIPSDEVAEDFRLALQDLAMNSRYEISNLTVIAKENTEHALAISEALKNHIKQTSPQKKLLAFYVLDSIVKNVGTPYTLFFGRQLYSTFMEAYALVDNNVRRKMDEMLKTWKEPVPGSIDTRPVFPSEVTRPIENALIKARTSAVQAHQEHLRSQQQLLNRGRPAASPVPHRDTATPPVARQQPSGLPAFASTYPVTHQLTQQYPGQLNGQQYGSQNANAPAYGLPQRLPTQQYPPQLAAAASWQPQSQGYGAVESSVDTLNSDLAHVISTAKAEFAQNPWDTSIQMRLKALLDLQTILQKQKLPPEQLFLIKDQIAQLSESAQPRHTVQALSAPTPAAESTPIQTPVAAPPAQQHTLSSLLGPGALAAFLARQSGTPQPASVQTSNFAAPIVQPLSNPKQPPLSTASASTTIPDPNSLLQRLREAGMLSATSAASNTPIVPQASVAGNVVLGFPTAPPFINTPPLSRTPLAEIPNDVVLKASSLKIPRPHLIFSLYEKLGAPCNQCGRRFQSDEEGKRKKTIHMDWHFRVNHRSSDAEKRGQHRSWYLDELDWIKSREVQDDLSSNNAESGDGLGSTDPLTLATPRLQHLPVPDDPALANSVCPICQEKFEMKWLDDAQEFVWMDAKRVGNRIYHASCYAEATKDGDTAQIKRGTPEPILGKRKADDDFLSMRAKVKTEPAA